MLFLLSDPGEMPIASPCPERHPWSTRPFRILLVRSRFRQETTARADTLPVPADGVPFAGVPPLWIMAAALHRPVGADPGHPGTRPTHTQGVSPAFGYGERSDEFPTGMPGCAYGPQNPDQKGGTLHRRAQCARALPLILLVGSAAWQLEHHHRRDRRAGAPGRGHRRGPIRTAPIIISCSASRTPQVRQISPRPTGPR